MSKAETRIDAVRHAHISPAAVPRQLVRSRHSLEYGLIGRRVHDDRFPDIVGDDELYEPLQGPVLYVRIAEELRWGGSILATRAAGQLGAATFTISERLFARDGIAKFVLEILHYLATTAVIPLQRCRRSNQYPHLDGHPR